MFNACITLCGCYEYLDSRPKVMRLPKLGLMTLSLGVWMPKTGVARSRRHD